MRNIIFSLVTIIGTISSASELTVKIAQDNCIVQSLEYRDSEPAKTFAVIRCANDIVVVMTTNADMKALLIAAKVGKSKIAFAAAPEKVSGSQRNFLKQLRVEE